MGSPVDCLRNQAVSAAVELISNQMEKQQVRSRSLTAATC